MQNKTNLTQNSKIRKMDNWQDYNALNVAVECGRKDVIKLMLQKNCRVNKTAGPPADAPLHNAVRLADPEVVSLLLDRRASVVAVNANNNSALHLAFLSKQEDVIDLMLDYIVRDSQYYNSVNDQGLTHLHIACTRRNARAIEGFLNNEASTNDTVNADSRLWGGYKCLHFAAEFKSLTAIKVLSKHNSFAFHLDCIDRDSNGQTPLQLLNKDLSELSIMASLLSPGHFSNFHMACVGDDANLLKSFLDNGAKANEEVSPLFGKFSSSLLPLHFAAQSENPENVKLLLQYGADARHCNNDGMTPAQSVLYTEKLSSDIRIGDMLYKATKCKINRLPDKNGLSFMHLACSRNDLNLVKHFLDKGQDVNGKVTYERQQFYHYTPLHFAIKYKNLQVVKYLIRRGADLNSGEDCVDGSPLHLACKLGHTDIIDFLLEQGADTKAVRSRDKKTVLQLLMEHCFEEAVIKDYSAMPSIYKVVKFGCDVNAQDVEGNTALHLAYNGTCTGRHFGKILLDVGADVNIQNNKGQTPFDCQLSDLFPDIFPKPGAYTILYHHVQELKMIGRTVSPKNEACCKSLFQQPKIGWDMNALDFQKDELARKQQERIDEIARMKEIKLKDDVSLYDFVRLGPEEARACAIHETLMGVLQKEFPVYGYLLRLQHQKAVGGAEVTAGGSRKRVAGQIEVVESQAAKRRRGAK